MSCKRMRLFWRGYSESEEKGLTIGLRFEKKGRMSVLEEEENSSKGTERKVGGIRARHYPRKQGKRKFLEHLKKGQK